MGGVAGVCLQVSCFVSCSLTAALLAVCLPLGSGAVCNYLESCQLCRLQRPKVNIIGAITKLISFSVATVCGASLAGPSIHEGMDAHGLCGRAPDSAGNVSVICNILMAVFSQS